MISCPYHPPQLELISADINGGVCVCVYGMRPCCTDPGPQGLQGSKTPASSAWGC